MTASKARDALRQWLVSGVTPAAGAPDELLAEAQRQGLVALLAAAPGFLEQLSAAARADWRRASQTLLVRGVCQLDLARRALALLRAESLRALPLKGAALAERLYGSVAERPMADLDLLVLDDPARAIRLFTNAGFRVVERADHAIALREPASGGVVELHRSFTSCPGLFPVDADGLWARRSIPAGTGEATLAPADLLVSLSLHAAFQHGFGLSLVQYLDFRRLLERCPPRTDQILEAAASARASGVVLGALLVARRVVGAQPDPALLTALEAKADAAVAGHVHALAARHPARLFAPEHPSLARMRFGLLAGRRLLLLRSTLWPVAWPDEPPRRQSLGTSARRAWRIARRELERHGGAAKARA
jgi:hypothetical protein